jgi:hypothetical protein
MTKGTMTFDAGQPTPPDPLPTAAGRRFRPPGDDDGIPSEPPAEVRAAVDAAWRRGAELAARGKELHFASDPHSGRLVVQLRTLAGEVLQTLSPSAVFDVIDGNLS